MVELKENREICGEIGLLKNKINDNALLSCLFSVIQERSFKNVLHAGCGNGYITERLKGTRIIGIDSSEENIKRARFRCLNRYDIDFKNYSILNISFDDVSPPFDLVLITDELYQQIIGNTQNLIYLICDELLAKGGLLISSHVKEYYSCRFPYTTLIREIFPLKGYTYIMEVYCKL